MTLARIVRKFLAAAIGPQSRGANIAVGPLVWDINPGHDRRYWYVVIAAEKAGKPVLTQLTSADPDCQRAEALRATLLAELATRRPPLVIHAFDDELQLAGFCNTIWPSARTKRLVADIKQERGAA
jgi:hypothetical protein